MRRTVACALAVIVVAVLGGAFPTHTRPLAALKNAALSNHDRVKAEEVCEAMVSDAFSDAVSQPLSAPAVGTWQRSRFTCTMSSSDGELRILVDVAASQRAARASFRALRTRAEVRTRFYGIGDDAFSALDGTHIAVTDNFILTVDPTRLSDGVDHDVVAWPTTRAIFDCW